MKKWILRTFFKKEISEIMKKLQQQQIQIQNLKTRIEYLTTKGI